MSWYLVLPFYTWLFTGVTKFAINCIREQRLAFDLIGYGGMPSNHSAIVSSMATYIGLNEGFDSAAFGAALTLAYIVILDANGLRQKVAQHAVRINQINHETPPLRERVGHSKPEILAGIITGAFCALSILTIQDML